MSTEPLHGVGHNNPPSDAQLLTERLMSENKADFEEANKLAQEFKSFDGKVEDEEQAQKAADFVKRSNACRKIIEKAEDKEKAPHNEKLKLVRTLFGAFSDTLEKNAKEGKRYLDKYLQDKTAKEQERLREEAKKAKETASALVTVAAAVSTVNEGAGDSAFEDALAAEVHGNKLQTASEKTVGLTAVRTTGGASAHLSSKTVAVIENLSDMDLNELKFSFKLDDIQKALNAHQKTGAPAPKGTRYEIQRSAVVR